MIIQHQIGGDFIGEGSYGCVFDKTLQCNNIKKNEKKILISKIFDKESTMIDEYKTMLRIKKIDPKYSFTVKMYNNCSISRKQLIEYDKNKDCKYSQKKNKQEIYYQITYDYGGIDLEHLNIENINFIDFFFACKNIFRGLQKLDTNNMLHLDIAKRNILYNKSTKKMKLIDFGFMTYQNRLLPKNDVLFDHPGDSYPPEFKLHHGFKIFGLEYNKYFYFINLQNNYDLHRIKKLLNVDVLPESSKLYDIYYEIFKKEGLDGITELIKKTTNKIDIYSFGCVLLKIIKKYNNLDKVENINFRIINLVYKMINFNPFYRITANDAYKEYKKIIKVL